MSWYFDRSIENRFQAVVSYESDRFGVRHAALEKEDLITPLIERAAQNMRGEDRVGSEDLIEAEEKLRLILAVATRLEMQRLEPYERLEWVTVDSLGLALERLCPLWPFC
jgi:hypothetical protein